MPKRRFYLHICRYFCNFVVYFKGVLLWLICMFLSLLAISPSGLMALPPVFVFAVPVVRIVIISGASVRLVFCSVLCVPGLPVIALSFRCGFFFRLAVSFVSVIVSSLCLPPAAAGFLFNIYTKRFMKCLQLEIDFQGQAAQIVAMNQVFSAPSLARGRQGVTPAVASVGGVSPVSHPECGWCAGCPFSHVCGDDCALTDDFMSNPSLSGTIFRNLNEFITFKKRFGWA